MQAIWNSIDNDAITVEEISEQDIANLFFSVGNKLDIKQVDLFYREVTAIIFWEEGLLILCRTLGRV